MGYIPIQKCHIVTYTELYKDPVIQKLIKCIRFINVNSLIKHLSINNSFKNPINLFH